MQIAINGATRQFQDQVSTPAGCDIMLVETSYNNPYLGIIVSIVEEVQVFERVLVEAFAPDGLLQANLRTAAEAEQIAVPRR